MDRRLNLPKTKYARQQKLSLWVNEPFDMTFFLLVMIILVIGLIMMFSASYASAYYEFGDSYYYIKRQCGFAAFGFALMLIISRINYKLLKSVAWLGYIVSIIMLILVLLVGSGDGIEKRWIYLGFNFQPSELAKLTLVILLAYYFSRYYDYLKKPLSGIVFPVLIIGAAAGLVLIEPHLSGAILIIIVGFGMMLIAGCNLPMMGAMGVIGAAGLYYFSTSVEYMASRIEIWKDPASDPQGLGYQILQSLYAIGSGGLTGLGLGQSRQKFLYIPKPQNDFVFSIVAEELGFIGCIIVLGLFAVLIYKGFIIAMRAPDKFGSFIVFGIMLRLAAQVLLNIAVVTNSIPVTGIALPFFSSGGTALVMQMIEMGIVLSVSRQSRITKT